MTNSEIKIKFDQRSTDFIVREGYRGPGFYSIKGFEKNGLYYVRANTNFKYLATKSLHRVEGDKMQVGVLTY